MNNILTEKQYQRYIIDRLVENGYVERKASNYDAALAIDRELLFNFLYETQPEKMAALEKVYKDNLRETLVNYINNFITQKKSSLLNALKHGIELANTKLDLLYTKPATGFNKELSELYRKNIFSVMEEVWASDDERIDLVIFLNGFAIMSFELKCNFAGQNYEDAIVQYRTERNPKTRLFRFKQGTIVNFAMDLNEVYMTTKLNGEATYFLPFNMGNGEGVNAGKGNPVFDDKYSVYYMWDDVLRKDTVLELLSKFIFISSEEKIDEKTGKTVTKEKVIFPRYHQLDCVRKILADVKVNKTSQNYLVQHSAGSGKTNSIAWLAHRLSSLHDADDKIIFDNVVIITDRVVVDRQLQKAVLGLEHKTGLIKVMDDKCSSTDLASALKGNTKIIATTIQKFPHILGAVKGLKDKHFAVIIDEAHSSTAGKDMAAVTKALGSDVDYESGDFDMDTEDIIVDEIAKNGKQPNVSVFAFTATPKPTTIQLFGTVTPKGQREAFHIYSMKQAIEEEFILDVLQNYTTYTTFYEINKAIEDDPKYKTSAAKRKIARFASLHEINIGQRVEIIIEHFRNYVSAELGGNAKAMVVTGSRPEAVKYYNAFLKYVESKGYTDVRPIVAFSGKVTGKQLEIDDEDYVCTESSLNGFSDDKTQRLFDTAEYQVMIVANKYQTGFDQPKLCAMYILKKLNNVNAVQTLSRLNRICPPYEKKVFILDFVNFYEEIEKSFEPYYTTTILSNTVNPALVYENEQKIDSYLIMDYDDIINFNELLYKSEITDTDRKKINSYLARAKKRFDALDIQVQREAYQAFRKFVRFYEFLIQISAFEDVELHKKYNFASYLVSYLKVRSGGSGFDLKDKITATNFVQKKTGEVTNPQHRSSPVVKLPVSDTFHLTEDKEKKLSEIISEINSRTGKAYDQDFTVKAMLQIRDILLKSDKLRTSANVNSLNDFAFSYYDEIDDALLEGLSQNKDFFNMLLGNEDIKKEVLDIFLEEIYKSLKDKRKKSDDK